MTLPVVMISGHGTVSTAVEATKAGAFDFIEKPLVERDSCSSPIRNALERTRLCATRTARSGAPPKSGTRWSARARRCARSWDAIKRAAPTNATVLITGESGVGKELVARVDPPQQPAQPRAVRPGQLRRDSRGADRVGALRPRERVVHRRHREADRQVRAGRPRHDLPRRSRRHERRRRRPRCCACCRKAKSSGSARRGRSRSTCASSRRPTRTSRRRSRRARSARISTSASASSRSTCRRCASAARTFRRSCGTSPISSAARTTARPPAVHAGGAGVLQQRPLEGQRPRAARTPSSG